MTTAAQRQARRIAWTNARTNARRAEDLGDHAGALIAAGEARRLMSQMTRDAINDQDERRAIDAPAVAAHMARMLGR